MSLKLHHSRGGDGPPVVVLHGLFGSGNNLGVLARSLQDSRCVYSVDLPNHGRSAWLADASLATMADSLANWMAHQGLASAQFVGHSLGGKVAMQLALSQPQLVAALLVADIAPVRYPPHHDEVFAALETVAASGCASRTAAAQLMSGHLPDASLVQFLLTGLRREPDGVYRWRFDVAGLRKGYDQLLAEPAAASAYPGPVLFIKGGESDYIREEHRSHIIRLFPHAGVKIMPGCGHWLHAERPSLFNSLVRRFLLANRPPVPAGSAEP